MDGSDVTDVTAVGVEIILMDGRRGKVVCHLHIGGDLKKEMKQEY